MRRHHQTLVLNLLDSLQEAHSEIKRSALSQDVSMVQMLLRDCGEAAARIRAFIRADKNQNCKMVLDLDKYREFLDRAAEDFQKTDVLRLLQKQLKRIRSDVKTKLQPDRAEIVFFPYKVSMFDCFESIYWAAKEDPRCEAYVVPIPYYDRLPDGSLGDMHYEGDQYPEDIPIIDWRSYQIEERHPEVVFIHNPYDETNCVTSIHPEYYCQRLRNFTDQLVLIPYSISSKDRVAEIFAVRPGTLYADKVIVQSETIRREYIQHLKRFEQNNHCRGIFGNLKEKFIALGSPKFDKAVIAQMKVMPIPQEWKKTQGQFNQKKTLLYNTSLNAILRKSETYLSKLRHVLEVCRIQKDIILLWRPHPLTEVTLRTMRPQMLDEYRNIVNNYCKQGWGIYDDTPDSHRAVALADAYYGDWSSLVPLFQCTGKPALLQDAGLIDDKRTVLPLQKERQLNILCFTAEQGIAYFYDGNIDGIFQMNMNDKKVKLETILPHSIEQKPFKGYLHMEKTGNYLVLAPCAAAGPVIYDLQEKKWRQYSLPVGTKKAAGLRHCCIWNNKVFFAPISSKYLVWLDLNREELKYCTTWLKGYPKENGLFSGTCGLPLLVGRKLFIPHQNPQGVVEFDCETMKTLTIHPLKDCITLAHDGENFWWGDLFGRVYHWKRDTEENRLICDLANLHTDKPDGKMVYFLAHANGYILALPHQYHNNSGCKSFKIRIDDEKVIELPELEIPAAKGDKQNLRCYCGARAAENRYIYTYCNYTNVFLRIDPEKDEIIKIPVSLDFNGICRCLKSYIREGPAFMLEHYLDILTSDSEERTLESVKECALAEEIAARQIILRHLGEGEPDIGVHVQDGRCGRRILEAVLNESGIERKSEG